MKTLSATALSVLLVASAAWAYEPPARRTAAAPALPQALAQQAVQAAIDYCSAKGDFFAVAVVDSAGGLKVLNMTEGNNAPIEESSIRKAFTAVTFNATTKSIGEKMKTDADVAAKVKSDPRFMTSPGGIPILYKGKLIGAIGVGGARDDHSCATAGVAKITAASHGDATAAP